VAVDGDVRRSLALDAATLRDGFDASAQRRWRELRESGATQRETAVRGVSLRAVLERAGLAERDRLDWRKSVVVVTARDGYRVTFSWPEIFNTEGGTQVMLVHERDGHPLADDEGPVALMAPADLRLGPRHVKWLRRIEVRILRD
jgi:DMSO/TMAO reductase YedYZ molybdopterin-dependent catalytic subunit